MSLMTTSLDGGMWLYRHTVKRLRPLHRLGYRAGGSFLDLLSKVTGFETMQEDPLWFRLHMHTGAFESETVHLINQIVKPGMVALDLGAHIGYYTRLLAERVGPAGHVIAFEPNPRTFAVLRRNVGSLKNVTAVNLAVTDKEENATLYDCLVDTGGSSLARNQRRVDDHKQALGRQELAPRVASGFPAVAHRVLTTSVDSYLAKDGIGQVDFVKMDIEGAEMQAIRGMRQMLSGAKSLSMIMEFNPRALRGFGTDPLDVWRELPEMGFRVMEIKGTGELQVLRDAKSVIALTELLDPRVGFANCVNWLCQKGRP